MISDSELQEMQALADAGFPGPWVAEKSTDDEVWAYRVRMSIRPDEEEDFLVVARVSEFQFYDEAYWKACQFIAAARTMVPKLLGEVREIKKYMAARGESYSAYQDTTNSIIQNQLTELRKLRTQLAEARKENAQFRDERLELEKDLGRAQILIRQHQEQSQTNLRLWEEAREEIKKFLANWEEVKPHVDAMCLMEANRGREYKGPFLDLEGLRKLI